MQVIEIEETLFTEIAAKAETLHKTNSAFVDELLRKALRKEKFQESKNSLPDKKTKELSDAEKVKRFIESYEKLPQQPEEYEIWQDEQAWEVQ
jgi:negative regulator of replication initiation